MSNSVVLPAEEATWAQTFVTVTPHDDGFLREIEENVVVSGPGDSPLHLDTWNIVLRRSLVNTTKDWIDPTELEQSGRVGAECQTYLQGVPNVELPLVYRDEATQTLYMGRDGLEAATPLEYFDDIITVLNEKPLPEIKTSRTVQTTIAMKGGASESDVIRMLNEDEDAIISNDSESSIETTEKEKAFMEASDILNFIVDRTLWMTKSESVEKPEKKNAEVQTLMKYNHIMKKLTLDYEIQTELTCKPNDSNSMLLADYTETKNFCRARVHECMEKGVYPRIAIDNIVEEIMIKCKRQIDFPFKEKIENKGPTFIDVPRDKERRGSSTRSGPRNKCSCKIVENWRRVECRKHDPEINLNSSRTPSMENQIVATSGSSTWTESSEYTSSSFSSRQTSSSERSLTSRDKRALGMLKSAFCSRDA